MLWGHADGATAALPEGQSSLPVTCLPVDSTDLFGWIILLASVQADSPCPRKLPVCGLEGEDPSTVPLHFRPQALHLVKQDLLAAPGSPACAPAVLLAWGVLPP